MQIPEEVLPLLKAVTRKVSRRQIPPDFWQIDHGPTILEAFSELASELALSELDERSLPEGYSLVACLFEWEAQCQFDGWSAFDNVSEEAFEKVLRSFERIGLSAEAKSLEAQRAAYLANPDDHEAIHSVLASHRHELSGDLDRLEHMTQYFCDHAAVLLYRQQT